MIDRAPEVMHLAIDLHVHLVEVPAPLPEPTHVRGPLFSDLAGHHSRTVSWQMSIPRSNSRSSTFRSDSGYFTYIITTRRITSRSEEHTSELQSLMRNSY